MYQLRLYGLDGCTEWKLGSKFMTPWLRKQCHLLEAPGYLWRFFCVRGSWFAMNVSNCYRVYLLVFGNWDTNYSIWLVEYLMRWKLCQLHIPFLEFSLHDFKIRFWNWTPACYLFCVGFAILASTIKIKCSSGRQINYHHPQILLKRLLCQVAIVHCSYLFRAQTALPSQGWLKGHDYIISYHRKSCIPWFWCEIGSCDIKSEAPRSFTLSPNVCVSTFLPDL